MNRASLAASAMLVFAAAWSPVFAGDTAWNELKSPHFTVISNLGERHTRSVAWQFEQARSAIAGVCPWARVDLSKPVTVLAVKDEASMRALVPQYWEEKKTVHPDAVWLESMDRYYIVVRADLRQDSGMETQIPNNPYQMAYFTYMHVVATSSFPVALPPWFSRGFAAVLSNTTVMNDAVYVGVPMVAYFQRLHARPPLRLSALLKTPADAPELRQAERLIDFDASAWTFVHFLLFSDNGTRRGRMDTLARLLQGGMAAPAAVEQALAPIEKLQDDYALYGSRIVLQYQRGTLDLAVKREALPVRRLTPVEAEGMQASFYAATGRSREASTHIAEARRLNPDAAPAYAAEGLLLDRAGERDKAKAAYELAAAKGTDVPYVYYRCAVLSWPADDNREALAAVEKWLSEAVRRDDRFAAAYVALARARATLTGDAEKAVPLLLRALTLEPGNPDHRWWAAATYLSLQQIDNADGEAQAGARMARTSDQHRAAREMLDTIQAARAATAARDARAREAEAANQRAADVNAKASACGSGDLTACAALAPWLESRCEEKDGRACGMLGSLHQVGRGVPVDTARAAHWYQRGCDAGDQPACVAFAWMQGEGAGTAKDETTALATLEKACDAGTPRACTPLAILLARRQRAADLPRVRTLLDRACAAGDAPACEFLKGLPRP
jgi:TPR repeat protein